MGQHRSRLGEATTSPSVVTKQPLMKVLVWPVEMYGCKSWTITATEEKSINAKMLLKLCLQNIQPVENVEGIWLQGYVKCWAKY